MYKLCYYVPDSHLSVTKEALFSVGAGSLGNYTKCAFQSYGIGQFLPNNKASPCIGNRESLQSVGEWKVEMLFPKFCLKQVIKALKDSHPYESPAFEVLEVHVCGK